MFGGIGKFLFGGEDDSAQQDAREGNAQAIKYLDESKDQARSDSYNLYPSIERNIDIGQRGAFELMRALMPAQRDAYRQGSMGAQQSIKHGSHNAMNAILGRPMIASMKPVEVDTPMPEMNYPEFDNASSRLRNKAVVDQLYNELLGRAPDAEGGMFWTDRMNGGLSAKLLRELLMGSQEYLGSASEDAVDPMTRENLNFNGRGA